MISRLPNDFDWSQPSDWVQRLATHAGLPPGTLDLFASGDAQPSAALVCLFRLVSRDPERQLAFLDGGEATTGGIVQSTHQSSPTIATPEEPEPLREFPADDAAAGIASLRASVRKQSRALESIGVLGDTTLEKSHDKPNSPWAEALNRVTRLVAASEQFAETLNVFEQRIRAFQKAGTRHPEVPPPFRPSPKAAVATPRNFQGSSVLALEKAQRRQLLHQTMAEKGHVVNADLRRIFGFSLVKASYELQRMDQLRFLERNGIGRFTTYTKGPRYHEIFGTPPASEDRPPI